MFFQLASYIKKMSFLCVQQPWLYHSWEVQESCDQNSMVIYIFCTHVGVNRKLQCLYHHSSTRSWCYCPGDLCELCSTTRWCWGSRGPHRKWTCPWSPGPRPKEGEKLKCIRSVYDRMFLTGLSHLISLTVKALCGENTLWCVFLAPSRWQKPWVSPEIIFSTFINSDSETIHKSKISSLWEDVVSFFSPAETSLWHKPFPSLISMRWGFYLQRSSMPTVEWQSPYICAFYYNYFILLFSWCSVQSSGVSLVCMESSRIA